MDKAGNVLRRGSVRLRSMNSSHGDLNMVISQLKESRTAAKSYMVSQNTAAQDILKWSLGDENRAIQDVMCQIVELNIIWTDVQKDFIEHLKEFKHQFEMVREGERHVDQARYRLTSCEQRELKIKKELKKAAKKAPTEEIKQLEVRLNQAERAKDLAQLEVVDRIRESETIKLVRVKEGLLKLSEAYVELAHKCQVIHETQRDITLELPDVHGKDIQDIKYTGAGATKQAVIQAKEKVRQYRQQSHRITQQTPSSFQDPPPPYSALCTNPEVTIGLIEPSLGHWSQHNPATPAPDYEPTNPFLSRQCPSSQDGGAASCAVLESIMQLHNEAGGPLSIISPPRAPSETSQDNDELSGAMGGVKL